MKIQRLLLLWVSCLSFSALNCDIIEKDDNPADVPPAVAFIGVPVADMLMHSARSINPFIAPTQLYNSLSVSPHDGRGACPRYRQLLNGDRVLVKELITGEAHIETAIQRYSPASATDHERIENDGWVLEKSVVTGEVAHAYDTLLAHPDMNRWVLMKPWHKDDESLVLSPGTFLVCNKTMSGKDRLVAYLPRTNPDRIEMVSIPTNVAVPLLERKPEEARALFVEAVQSLAKQTSEGILAHVWGGQSAHKRVPSSQRHPEIKDVPDRLTAAQAWYDRALKQHPFSGVDASGLILLAARIANIPLHYNNTATMEHFLPEVTDMSQLKIGDLVWVPGFMGVITSLERNTIASAEGYSRGEGCVRERKIGDYFSNVTSLNDLFDLKKRNGHLICASTHAPAEKFKVLSLLS